MIIKKCPKCLSTEIDLYLGGALGQYSCTKCGYIGALIIEEEIEKPSQLNEE